MDLDPAALWAGPVRPDPRTPREEGGAPEAAQNRPR